MAAASFWNPRGATCGSSAARSLGTAAKRDLVLHLGVESLAGVSVSPSYVKVLKGASSAAVFALMSGGSDSGAPVISVTDPSGAIAPASVTVPAAVEPVPSWPQ